MPRFLAVALSLVGTAALVVPQAAPAPLRIAATPTPKAAEAPASEVGRTAPCPVDSLPDGDGCVRLPNPDDDGLDAPVATNAHREKTGAWATYDQIPRRPDRPAEYDSYRYPVPPALAGGHAVVSGYDLDLPDGRQRRGTTMRAVGHGAVDLPQARGTPVKATLLEHEIGEPEVQYVGSVFGTTVVTRHTVREGGVVREYLLFYGHLDRPAAGLLPGMRLREGDVVGYVGDTGSPELVHLHLEARRVRDGVDVRSLAPKQLLAAEVSIVCDPRNVLPLR